MAKQLPPPVQLNGDEFRKAASCVLQNIGQIFCIFFWDGIGEPNLALLPVEVNDAFKNACLESSLIQLRAFDDFCCSRRLRDDDLVPDNFPGLTSNVGFLTGQDRLEINKRIAHFTLHGADRVPYGYDYRRYLAGAIPQALRFCQYLLDHMELDEGLSVHTTSTVETLLSIQLNYVIRGLEAKPYCSGALDAYRAKA